jgi:dephospho-CoA kinase
MLKIGLTGGIASGKTTVAAMLRNRGCAVLEMDPIGHRLLDAGNAASERVVREFGRDILSDGAIDRSKLAALVFSDTAKRNRLNAILHPPILEQVRQWFAGLDRPGGPEFALAEAALIFESGYSKELDCNIVCWCRAEQQLARLEQRGLRQEEARARLAAQMPIDEKRKLADEVIDCSKSLDETERQVEALVEKLRKLRRTGTENSTGNNRANSRVMP